MTMTARKNETPEERESRLAYLHEYRSRPENKARKNEQAREISEEKREKRKKYLRDYMREYSRTPEGKAKNAARKAKYRATPEGMAKSRAYHRQWSKDNPEKARASSFKAHHGVTRDEADAMIEAQGNLCAICGQPPGTKKPNHRLHVDHCHETGEIRAMLCGKCNKALGLLQDSPELLEVAAKYLRSFQHKSGSVDSRD